VLNRTLVLERRAIAAYEAAIPLLSGTDKLVATVCLKQDLLHAGRLIALITALDGPVAGQAESYKLGRPRTTRQLVGLLHKVEQAQVAGYLEAVTQVPAGRLRAAIVAILANDAQHVTLIRGALGELPVPSPFASGRE
jgi:hypothetical protein